MSAIRRGIVTHGGAGAPPSLSGGCEAAARAGMARMTEHGSALDAAMAAVVSMEDDGRFNAGSGSVLRLDGKTIEMDASVMDSTGKLGAVACIAGVRNPVLVARCVAETPHVLLSGEGAVLFARACGFPPYHRVSQRALDRHRHVVEALRKRDPVALAGSWQGFDIERYWNFAVPYRDVVEAGDTVGAVVLGEDGVFAVAGSTGGSSPMLRGRIGDTPVVGCGFFAGEAGAVAATGIGEEIMRRTLAREVYNAIAAGADPRAACELMAASFPPGVPVGIIAIARTGTAIASNVPMASHALVE